jgi:hypothetical protein
MRERTWAVTLLSLGTAPEDAVAIEGDLIEERTARGGTWFAAQVVLVSLSLLRRSLLVTPVQALLTGYAVYELALKLQWWGVAPLRRLLRHDLALTEPAVLGATLASWVVVGGLVGLLLVRFLPAIGLRSAIVAIVLLELRLLILDAEVSPVLLFAFGALPLLCGCVMGHRHNLARHALPPHRPGNLYKEQS